MRVLFSTYDSRGGVEPLVGLAVRLRRRALVAHGWADLALTDDRDRSGRHDPHGRRDGGGDPAARR